MDVHTASASPWMDVHLGGEMFDAALLCTRTAHVQYSTVQYVVMKIKDELSIS